MNYPSKLLSLFLLVGLIASCGSSSNNSIAGIVTPSTAVDDSFQALGNAILRVTEAEGVRANDLHSGASVVSFDSVGSSGGSVAMNPDGSFEYTPPAGFRGTDTFSYTLGNGAGGSSATVTVAIDSLGYFVDNTAGPNGDGSLASPFNSLSRAMAVPPVAGDLVFVFRGDGTNNGLSGAVNLPEGVSLVGEGLGLAFPDIASEQSSVQAREILPRGQFPQLTGPINLSRDNLVGGLSFDQLNRNFISGSSFSNASLVGNQFTIPTFGGPSILLTDYSGELVIVGNEFKGGNVIINQSDSGSLTIRDNVFPSSGANGLELNMKGGSNTLSVVGNQAQSWVKLLVLTTSNDAFVEGTVSNNTSTNAVVGMEFSGGSSRAANLDFSNNSISASIYCLDISGALSAQIDNNSLTVTEGGNSAIFIQEPSLNARFQVTGNTISDPLNNQPISILVGTGGVGYYSVQLRDNVVTGSTSAGFTAQGFAGQCIDMVGNTFPLVSFDNRSCDVERFNSASGGPLGSINTIGSIQDQIGVTARPAGFCGF